MRRDTPGVSDGWKLVPRTAAAVSSCYFINTTQLFELDEKNKDGHDTITGI